MLSIKKTFRSYLPQFHGTSSGMKLSPVTSESDELIQAIEEDITRHDDNWTLEVTPDTERLEQDWSRIQQDIEKDPEWVRFSDE